QIVANPLAIKMGSPNTGAHRLTLAGGINSLGTTIGPILVGLALFGSGGEKKPQDSGEKTKIEVLTDSYHAQKDELINNITELSKDRNAEAKSVETTIQKVNTQIALLDQQLNLMQTQPNANDEQIEVFAKK